MSTQNFTKSLRRLVGILGATSATALMSLPVLAQLNPNPSIFNEAPYNGRRAEQSTSQSDQSTSEQCLPRNTQSSGQSYPRSSATTTRPDATANNGSASDLSLQDPTTNRPQADSTSSSTSSNRPIYRVNPTDSSMMDSGTTNNTSTYGNQTSMGSMNVRPYTTSDAPNPAVVTRPEDQAGHSNSNSTLNPVRPGSFNARSSNTSSYDMNSSNMGNSVSPSIRSSSMSTMTSTMTSPEAGNSESSPLDYAGSSVNNQSINDLNGSSIRSTSSTTRNSQTSGSMMTPGNNSSSQYPMSGSTALCK